MHPGGVGRTRTERVAQSLSGVEPSLHDSAAYVPIGSACEKLRAWVAQGAQVAYLTSHRNPIDVELDTKVLANHGFPPGRVLARSFTETYGEVVANDLPNILIEDDCESIGTGEIAYFQVPQSLRWGIRSIIVSEFGGIDHLPNSLEELIGTAETDRRAPP